MKKRLSFLLILTLLALGLVVGCGNETTSEAPETEATEVVEEEKTEESEVTEEAEATDDEAEVASDIPTLTVGYMFSNHQTPLVVAAAKNEDFKDESVYLKEVVPKEKYVMMSGDEEIANIDYVVAENGGEVMTLMTQGHLDLAMSSIGLPMTTVDQGFDMSIISPIHVDGIGLVMPIDSDVEGFEGFASFVDSADEPVVVGYHSPANAPVILFDTAMREAGYTVTENVEETDADILLINLKGTSNLIPSLLAGEVDAFIGPSPFPEMADLQGSGKVVLDLRDLPPEGKWHNFPCCVFSASDETLSTYPEEVAMFHDLLSISADFANENREETGTIISEWMGVDLEAAQNTATVFTTDPNESWMTNSEVTYNSMQETDRFEGDFATIPFSEAQELIFDLSPTEE